VDWRIVSMITLWTGTSAEVLDQLPTRCPEKPFSGTVRLCRSVLGVPFTARAASHADLTQGVWCRSPCWRRQFLFPAPARLTTSKVLPNTTPSTQVALRRKGGARPRYSAVL